MKKCVLCAHKGAAAAAAAAGDAAGYTAGDAAGEVNETNSSHVLSTMYPEYTSTVYCTVT